MSKLESHFNASVLLRIGHKNSIKDCWDNNRLSFGCAANWVHYAQKGNMTTGDLYECVFSRIPKGKAIDLFDRNGKRIEANLQRFLDDKDSNFEFLRYVPTMLTPALCFYSLSYATPDDGLFVWDETRNMPMFRADRYAQYMGYANEEMGVLLIQDFCGLISDLKEQIPLAIKENRYNLTQERYHISAPTEEVLFANVIDYSRHQRFDIFEEEPAPPEELFWKFPEYKKQAELRIVIPHWNFIQSYDPFKPEKYDKEKNYLPVNLPQLHSYASLFIPSEQRLEGRFWNR